jgi:hypothetical protein
MRAPLTRTPRIARPPAPEFGMPRRDPARFAIPTPEIRPPCLRAEDRASDDGAAAGRDPDSVLLPLAEAAPRIGVDVATLRAWSREGLLALVACEGTAHVPLSEVARVRRALGFPE